MTVTLQAWAVPLAITVVIWLWAAYWPAKDSHGDYDFSGIFDMLLRLFIAIAVTLVAWLVWALWMLA